MSAWLALLLVDTVAVVSFARCFTGPGELLAALATLFAVHAVALKARGGIEGIHAAGRVRGGVGAAQPTRPAWDKEGWWALAGAVALLLPVGIVLGWTFTFVVPAGHTWHVLSRDLAAGWNAFSFKVSPVPELPGLVLAIAWAAGAAGLTSERISSSRTVPAAFALAPALTLYLFAAALGTGSWRAVGLAFMAGAACWYLVAVSRERDSAQEVLVASADTALTVGERAASYGAGAVMLRMAVLAAVAAAVIGPNLPGAGSQPLVSWHGNGKGGHSTSSTVIRGGSLPQGIEISTLVQVAEEEVVNPSVVLFTVHSSTPTRELIATLDRFDGNAWSASRAGSSQTVPMFYPPMTQYERNPPRPVPDGRGHEQLVQVFQVALLAGFNVPTWGEPLAVANTGELSRNGPGGAVVSDTALQQGAVYAIRSEVTDPTPAELQAASTDLSDPQDLQLPLPIPSRLVSLANRIVQGATSPYVRALDIDAYLTSSRFRYHLPTRTKSGGVNAPAPGYGDLLNFLFKTRTGYCQQFATAFAVLARLDGLPTRIAVGFLPGSSVGHDTWAVDGTDTHAWPQVKFTGYGWVDFEPTPGATVRGSSAPPSTGSATKPVTTPKTTGRAHNLRRPGGIGSSGRVGITSLIHRPHRSTSSSAPWLLVIPAVIVAWAGGVPLWRRSRLRRARREPRAGILAAWGEALRMLDLAGIRRRRAETYLELARRVSSSGLLSGEAEIALRDLARLATSASYAAAPPEPGGSRQALEAARKVAKSARRRIARWQRVAAALDPRSLPA